VIYLALIKPMKFLVVGGDMRFVYLMNQLSEDGNTVLAYATDPAQAKDYITQKVETEDVDCVILPLPAVNNEDYINTPMSDMQLKAEELFSQLTPGMRVVAGKVHKDLYEIAEKYGITLVDYEAREELAVLNAIPTVEGACAIAMSELPYTLHGAKALVIGYGRIGKLLAKQLKSFGCGTLVSARRDSDLAWIEAYGYKGVRTKEIGDIISDIDVVFNTVPVTVIDDGILGKMSKDTLIIDLASKPGGAGFLLNRSAIPCGLRAVRDSGNRGEIYWKHKMSAIWAAQPKWRSFYTKPGLALTSWL
jgi:dipicolinate synthase subunit A